MQFDKLIPWLIPIFLIVGPIIFTWLRKREANTSTTLPNEAPVKWRQLNKSEDKPPFIGWASSKRSTLRITSDGIYCNGTAISLNAIEKAIIYSPKDQPLWQGLSSVLRIVTDEGIHDFSISPFRLEKMELPFEVIKEEAKAMPKIYSRLLFIAFIIIIIITVLINRP